MMDKIALSFGAGRHTTAMLVLVAQGELPKPDFVTFADTGCEWPETYDYIERYIRPLCVELGIQYHVVSSSSEKWQTLWDYYAHYRTIPWIADRACTKNWKIAPLRKFFLQVAVTLEWVGFAANERGRAANKKPIARGILSAFPLIELNINSSDCEHLIQKYGLPLPLKSSCIFCPFQHPWRARMLYERHPDLFEKVGQLEDRALLRRPGYYILGDKPWRSWGVIQPSIFGEDWQYGCQDGYCFR